MPTYDYKCEACDYEFEKFHAITADPIKECPECGEEKVNRMVSAGMGVIFKGSGFYSTDYRDSSYKTDKTSAESSNTPCATAKSCPSASNACGSN
ncbi:MAG: zinc ribbon domain-containing protein [Spirochaetota bacterium]|nr:zinc ribbon domain-containing protein [Spirochaetota bacterium]